MKNEELWGSYDLYTKDATSHARKLAFACAAICWFFKTPSNEFPSFVLWSLFLVVVYFFLDMAQIVIAAATLRFWTRTQEKKRFAESGNIEGEFDKPYSLDIVPYACWWLKIIALFSAFVLLGTHLWTNGGVHASQ